MLSAQQFYQPQYNEQAVWQHGGQQNHTSISHAQQQSSKLAQDPHYTRIAVNQNHVNQNSNVRQPANNDTQDNGGASLSMLNQQGSSGTEQLMEENQKVLVWVAELMDPARREGALMELSKKREQVPELALILWHSFGVMTSLLQEIISVYPLLNPSQLTAAASNRVCNALALLQCVASHNETRGLFLNGTLCLLAR
jgi:CCR4-NOT transcription complex subunit 9